MIWYFSAAPSYDRLGEDRALLRVSFSHAGEPREPCRRFTPEEIDDLEAFMETLNGSWPNLASASSWP